MRRRIRSYYFPTWQTDRSGCGRGMDRDKRELGLVWAHYPMYQRQYVGLIIDGDKYVLCNYSYGSNVDFTSEYVFIQNVFEDDGTIHFLQCRVDPFAKTCSNVSYMGRGRRGEGDQVAGVRTPVTNQPER